MANLLSSPDYVIIAAMLAISTAIGIFFAVRSRGQQSSNDYFLGSQKMSAVPVSFSITVSLISAATYLGLPAEVYLYGPTFGLILLVRVHVPLLVAFFFVPVYYNLKVTTMYQYLGMRFGNTLRYLVASINIINSFIRIGIVVYAPSLALSLAAGISLPVAILSIGIICTIYTSIGGIKAVIWTDVFQAFSMLIGVLGLIVAGNAAYGGPTEGWRRAVKGGRGDLVDFSIDPTIRFTFWSTIFGGTFFWLSAGVSSQSLIQRYNSCKSLQEAKLASWLGLIGMALFELLAIAAGMTAFAYYYKCDPLTSGQISLPDQIMPFFILDLFHSYPGVPGLLIGGAFSASLSSMSSTLNGIVAAVGNDIVKRIWPHLSDYRYSILMKVMSCVFGVLGIALAFFASVLGNVLQTVYSVAGVIGGPITGVIILGMFFPRANSIGAISGLIGGTAIGIVQYVGSQVFRSSRIHLPLSVDSCIANNNMSYQLSTLTSHTEGITLVDIVRSTTSEYMSTSIPINPDADSPAFFGLSYLYILALTSTSCVVIGIVTSYATSWKNPRVADPVLLTPLIARFYANKDTHNKNEHEQKGGNHIDLYQI